MIRGVHLHFSKIKLKQSGGGKPSACFLHKQRAWLMKTETMALLCKQDIHRRKHLLQ